MAGRVSAEPEVSQSSVATPALPTPAVHELYVNLLGKGGLWGLGYDWRPTARLAFGAVGSLYVLGGDRFVTFSPYIGIYPIVGAHHGWFVHFGPQVTRRTTASPGPEWSGMTTTGFDAELSSGYEYRNHILLRAYVMGAAGAHVVPWIGGSLGWTL